jgi:hypothetical protein
MLKAGRSLVRVPIGVIDFFSIFLISLTALGPGVYSASEGDEYKKKYFW